MYDFLGTPREAATRSVAVFSLAKNIRYGDSGLILNDVHQNSHGDWAKFLPMAPRDDAQDMPGRIRFAEALW